MRRIFTIFLVTTCYGLSMLDKCAVVVASARGKRMSRLGAGTNLDKYSTMLLTGAPPEYVIIERLYLKVSQLIGMHAVCIMRLLERLCRLVESPMKQKQKMADFASYKVSFLSSTGGLEDQIKAALAAVAVVATDEDISFISDFQETIEGYRRDLKKITFIEGTVPVSIVAAFDSVTTARHRINLQVPDILARAIRRWSGSCSNARSVALGILRSLLLLAIQVGSGIQDGQTIERFFLPFFFANSVLLTHLCNGFTRKPEAQGVYEKFQTELSGLRETMKKFRPEHATAFQSAAYRAFVAFVDFSGSN